MGMTGVHDSPALGQTRPVRAGLRHPPAEPRGDLYVDHYPFLGVLPEEAGGAVDINDLYAARFGVPPAGKRVYIRTVQQINGWQDRPQTFSARVPPA